MLALALPATCLPDKLRVCEHCENVNNFYRKFLPAMAIRAKNFRRAGMVVRMLMAVQRQRQLGFCQSYD